MELPPVGTVLIWLVTSLAHSLSFFCSLSLRPPSSSLSSYLHISTPIHSPSDPHLAKYQTTTHPCPHGAYITVGLGRQYSKISILIIYHTGKWYVPSRKIKQTDAMSHGRGYVLSFSTKVFREGITVKGHLSKAWKEKKESAPWRRGTPQS